jgi:hypothetical protein
MRPALPRGRPRRRGRFGAIRRLDGPDRVFSPSTSWSAPSLYANKRLPSAGTKGHVDVAIQDQGSEGLPKGVQASVRWDPIDVAVAPADPANEVDSAAPGRAAAPAAAPEPKHRPRRLHRARRGTCGRRLSRAAPRKPPKNETKTGRRPTRTNTSAAAGPWRRSLPEARLQPRLEYRPKPAGRVA